MLSQHGYSGFQISFVWVRFLLLVFVCSPEICFFFFRWFVRSNPNYWWRTTAFLCFPSSTHQYVFPTYYRWMVDNDSHFEWANWSFYISLPMFAICYRYFTMLEDILPLLYHVLLYLPYLSRWNFDPFSPFSRLGATSMLDAACGDAAWCDP